MADLPLVQLPYPEEEQPKTLYARITNTNEPPKFDDIMNSDLSRDEKVKQIQYRTKAYQDDVDRELHKNYARIGLGGLVSAVGALPIAITKNPVIGSAIGGGVYELGQGIMEGDEFPELMQRSGFGAAIGGAAGGVVSKAPQAAKFVNDLSGSKIGNALKPIGDKITNSKLYDALMTDIRAFNPNKQTAYHGSPYDFNKFSNEAIGTGEGAQAHGLGHYAAKQKNIAENYANVLSNEKPIEIKYKGEKYKVNFNDDIMDWDIQGNVENLTPTERSLFEKIDSSRDLDHIKELELKQIDRMKRMQGRKNRFRDAQKSKDIINILDSGDLEILPTNKQLYKLSVPKDDVMLREGASFENQPELVQKGLNNIKKDYLKSKGYNSIDDINAELDSLSNQYENIVKNESPYNFNAGIEKSEIQAKISQLENLRRFNETPDLYNYLLNHQHLEPHEVSDLLYKQGIKGISYNGGIDGEARVIFNPDDIVIGRKYYNQPNLYQQLTGKQNTGALVDALFNR
jgi:hypothetical protein